MKSIIRNIKRDKNKYIYKNNKYHSIYYNCCKYYSCYYSYQEKKFHNKTQSYYFQDKTHAYYKKHNYHYYYFNDKEFDLL
jgi:hypothetical protein